jgi:arylsulfatase A-like enzyme
VTRPNVLILMADQFRGDLVGANGGPIRTPHLDRLAAGGVSFGRAYTTTTLCTPARGALFTGRYPHSNGLTANTQYPESPTPRLPAREKLLFQHLAAAGYRCGYAGKWHLNVGDEAAEAHARGVHDFFNGPACRRAHYERLRLAPRDDVNRARQRTMAGAHPPMSGVMPYPEAYHLDVAIAAQAVELLRAYERDGLGTTDRPFALTCSFHGPHFPIEVPEPYASLYDPRSVPRPASFDDTFEGKPQGQTTHPWLNLGRHLSWEEWQRVIGHYWGFCTFVDALMGRVLDALDASAFSERTLVLATADHGEMAGHHRFFDKGPYFYEDVLRVPFVWRYPGRIAPRSGGSSGSDADFSLVSHVDVVPTVLDLTGLSPEANSPPLQGRSLFAANAERADAAFGEATPGDVPNPQVHARVVIADRWKYVYRPEDDVQHELYDLAADPDEMRNLAPSPQHAGVLRTLQDRLRDWMHLTDDTLDPPEIGLP